MSDKFENFVKFVVEGCKNDSGFRARFSRASNPDLEYEVWPDLVKWCDIENKGERMAFSLVGSAIAQSRADSNGSIKFAVALRKSYKNDSNNEPSPASMRLKRIISCDTRNDLVSILRQVLPLVVKDNRINFADLLNDIIKWGEGIKVKWIKDFYGKRSEEEEDATNK